MFGAKTGWRDQGWHEEIVKRKLSVLENKQQLERICIIC